MPPWEYRTVKIDSGGFWGGKVDESKLDRLLNELGREGWELATAMDTNAGYGATRHILYTFKRPLK